MTETQFSVAAARSPRATRFPPGPNTLEFARLTLALRGKPIAFLSRIAHDYGDLAHWQIGRTHYYLINHPDYVSDVLVTNNQLFIKDSRGLRMTKRLFGEGLTVSNGEFHTQQRRLVSPAFHYKRVSTYAESASEHAAQTRERWRDGETRDIHQDMLHLTLGVVAKTLFDTNVDSEADEVGDAVTTLFSFYPRIANRFNPIIERLPLASNQRMRQAVEQIDSIIYRIIEEHRTNGRDRGDLLSMLMRAQDDEGDGRRMTNRQLRNEAVTFFVAGHETSASTLTWSLYLLSQDPEVEAKLYAELESVLGGRLPTAKDVASLKYTRMIIAEAMRLYPPIWIMGRMAAEDYKIENYVAPAKSQFIFSEYLLHRDPRFFPEPDRFDPERWTEEKAAARPRLAYFPFGAGPRVCIGESFAWMETILSLATIAQKWQLRLAPGHPVEIQPTFTLRPKYGMRMITKKR